MLPPGDVHVLAETRVCEGLQELEAAQDLDGVGGEGQAVATAHVVGEGRGEEGERPQLGVSEWSHGGPSSLGTVWASAGAPGTSRVRGRTSVSRGRRFKSSSVPHFGLKCLIDGYVR